jgi:hypothetical protein
VGQGGLVLTPFLLPKFSELLDVEDFYYDYFLGQQKLHMSRETQRNTWDRLLLLLLLLFLIFILILWFCAREDTNLHGARVLCYIVLVLLWTGTVIGRFLLFAIL